MSRIYFTDRDLGKRFPEILTAAGLQVERHHDFFPPDGPDEQWLKYCGRQGRVAITHDQRIRYRPNERAAVEQYGVALHIHQAPSVPDNPATLAAWMINSGCKSQALTLLKRL